jgi:mRNA interferase RelE/StbE
LRVSIIKENTGRQKIYKIFLKKSVAKFLDKIPDNHYSIISKNISALTNDPRPFNSKKIATDEKNIYRIRVSRYRIIYFIDETNKIINILEIKLRRENTYKNF